MKDQNLSLLNVVAATPVVCPGNPAKNAERIVRMIENILGKEKKISLIVFPELSIPGYTCGDMIMSDDMIDQCDQALLRIEELLSERTNPKVTTSGDLFILVGTVLRGRSGKIYNAAAVLDKFGNIQGYACKSFLPEYSEFYEKRWFTPWNSDIPQSEWEDGVVVSQTWRFDDWTLGIELCEDLWVPQSPSIQMVTSGNADVIANLSASPKLVGKEDYVRKLIEVTSAKLMCGYVYSGAGPSESSTDLVFSGTQLIYSNGELRGERSSEVSVKMSDYTVGTIDLGSLRHYRKRSAGWIPQSKEMVPVKCVGKSSPIFSLRESYFRPSKDPFQNADLKEVVEIQLLGLQKRLTAIGQRKVVIGISGGSDSTLALLIAYDAFEKLGLPKEGIIGISMPCFGTSERTKNNASGLMKGLEITGREIDITKTVTQHLEDLGHSLDVHDIAYENAQARTRTQTLFNVSNMEGGALVIGTGDLSELALGWCTYGADHLSSYNPNVSIPKTLVKRILSEIYSETTFTLKDEVIDIIKDIIDTPVSPELIPANSDGTIKQVTQDTVGPYELHDFFLYHMIRSGWSGWKICKIASEVFSDKYDAVVVKRWFKYFLKRFHSQQFKRSCLPDGPKVGSLSLSPRGDWRMPSDMDPEGLLKVIGLDALKEVKVIAESQRVIITIEGESWIVEDRDLIGFTLPSIGIVPSIIAYQKEIDEAWQAVYNRNLLKGVRSIHMINDGPGVSLKCYYNTKDDSVNYSAMGEIKKFFLRKIDYNGYNENFRKA